MKLFSLRTLSMAVLLSLALVLGTQPSAHALLIDSFDLDQAQIGDGLNDGGGDTSGPLAVTIGSELGTPNRTIFVQSTSSDFPTNNQTFAGVDNGVYSHNQQSGVKGYSTVTWDNFGTVDLTAGGGLGIKFHVLTSDLGGNATIRLNGSATGSTIAIPAVTFPGQDFTFLFTGLPGASSVNQILLEIDGRNTSALDLTVDFVETAVPEPASLLLLGSGLLGLGWLRRRQNIANALFIQ